MFNFRTLKYISDSIRVPTCFQGGEFLDILLKNEMKTEAFELQKRIVKENANKIEEKAFLARILVYFIKNESPKIILTVSYCATWWPIKRLILGTFEIGQYQNYSDCGNVVIWVVFIGCRQSRGEFANELVQFHIFCWKNSSNSKRWF